MNSEDIPIPDNAFSLAMPGEKVSEHNIYKPGYGYITDHIPPNQQRGHQIHWDEQYAESTSFEKSWKPRPGALEFVYNLARQSDYPLVILNMGAGLGDFTVDLARIPNTMIHHVDFSQQGNEIAKQKVAVAQAQNQAKIHTMDNDTYLQEFIDSGERADIVFLYGASGSNEPSDTLYKKTLELSTSALQNGGYLWHVTMIQPRLIDRSDTSIQDTLGDFPKPPKMAKAILLETGLELVREETEERPDFHPLVPGEIPVHHIHLAYRALFVRPGNEDALFEFGFQGAINPNWKTIWKNLSISKDGPC